MIGMMMVVVVVVSRWGSPSGPAPPRALTPGPSPAVVGCFGGEGGGV